MYAKIIISGTIEVLTGLHIGGSSDFSAIGAIDSPVVRDSLTKLPMIPGSTLKGKMRYLLAKVINPANLNPNNDHQKILRLFGSSASGADKQIIRAKLKFNDCLLSNYDELYKKRVSPTEVKYENTISRETSKATPRQIERVVRGSQFDFEIFYDLTATNELLTDFENIKKAFDLLAYDYLGGHGTRGSGRIQFNNLSARVAIGECCQIDVLNQILGASYDQ